MCGIGNRHLERVAEDRGCLHELDSVLLEILGRLVRVPFEFHSEILSSSVPIGITSYGCTAPFRGRLAIEFDPPAHDFSRGDHHRHILTAAGFRFDQAAAVRPGVGRSV